jgi:hypothetical protein
MESVALARSAVGIMVGHSEPFGCAQGKLREESLTRIPENRLLTAFGVTNHWE